MGIWVSLIESGRWFCGVVINAEKLIKNYSFFSLKGNLFIFNDPLLGMISGGKAMFVHGN